MELESAPMEQLPLWIAAARQEAKKGGLPTYIPLLAQKDPSDFAFCYLFLDGEIYLNGSTDLRFPLMSVIKPFLLLYLLARLEPHRLLAQVGREPSDYSFNSLTQLQLDGGFPRNPMLNSGAIRLASLIDSPLEVVGWLNALAGSSLELDSFMLASVKSLPNQRNLALAQEMYSRGYLDDIPTALENYNYLCCLAGTAMDVARLGLMLLQCPPPLEPACCQITQELMSTCGLYQSSKTFAQEIGFPSKSGVSGVMLSLVPQKGAIACYSPPLNPDGNSTAAMFLLSKIARG